MNYSYQKHDTVFTSDEQCLGHVVRLYNRPIADVNPAQKLFAHYLLVSNLEIGDSFYIPTDYVTGRDDKEKQIALSLSMKEVAHETLTREPEFVAIGQAEKVNL